MLKISLLIFICITNSAWDAYYGARSFNVYQYHHPGGDHLYTQFPDEIGQLIPGQTGRHGFIFDNIAFKLEPNSEYRADRILYRYWHPNTGDHLYTTNPYEINAPKFGEFGNFGYKSEGIVGKCYSTKIFPTLVPLYRYWNGQDHFYTVNINDIGTSILGHIGANNYKFEGIECYVILPYYNRMPEQTVWGAHFKYHQHVNKNSHQCKTWLSFVKMLPNDGITGLRVFGERNQVGYECRDSKAIKKIVDQLKNCRHSGYGEVYFKNCASIACGGNYWNVGSCTTEGAGINTLEVGPIQQSCKCTTGQGWTAHPCLGYWNFGGLDGPTCDAPSQWLAMGYESTDTTWVGVMKSEEASLLGSQQCTSWLNYISSIPPHNVYKLRVYGSKDMIGFECDDTIKIKQITNLLKTCTNNNQNCGVINCQNNYWYIGSCVHTSQIQTHRNALQVSTKSDHNLCDCHFNVSIWSSRPCSGDANWGGVGQNCESESQTLYMDYDYHPYVNAKRLKLDNMLLNDENIENALNYWKIVAFVTIGILLVACSILMYVIIKRMKSKKYTMLPTENVYTSESESETDF